MGKYDNISDEKVRNMMIASDEAEKEKIMNRIDNILNAWKGNAEVLETCSDCIQNSMAIDKLEEELRTCIKELKELEVDVLVELPNRFPQLTKENVESFLEENSEDTEGGKLSKRKVRKSKRKQHNVRKSKRRGGKSTKRRNTKKH